MKPAAFPPPASSRCRSILAAFSPPGPAGSIALAHEGRFAVTALRASSAGAALAIYGARFIQRKTENL